MGRRQSVGRREGDESGEPTQDRRQQLGRRAEDAEEAVRQALERGALDRTSAQGIFDIVRRGDVSEDALEELARALNVMAPPKPSAEQVGDEPDAGTVTDVIEQAAQQAAQESE